MSYEDQAALAGDQLFLGRLGACVVTEARSHSDPLAGQVLQGGFTYAAGVFLPWVSSEPGFSVPSSSITDGMLLSAVQAVWPAVAAGATDA